MQRLFNYVVAIGLFLALPALVNNPCTGERLEELVEGDSGELITVYCNLMLNAKEQTQIPEVLYPFWESRLNSHSFNGRAQYSESSCYESQDFCVIQWNEPLPSGWSGYLSVVNNNQVKAKAELIMTDDTYLSSYSSSSAGLLVTTIERTFNHNTQKHENVLHLYQLVNSEFVHLSQTKLCNKKDAVACKEQ